MTDTVNPKGLREKKNIKNKKYSGVHYFPLSVFAPGGVKTAKNSSSKVVNVVRSRIAGRNFHRF